MLLRKLVLLKRSIFRLLFIIIILLIAVIISIYPPFSVQRVTLDYTSPFSRRDSPQVTSLPFPIPKNYLLIPYKEFVLRTSIACRMFKFEYPQKNPLALHPKYSKYLNGTFRFVIPSKKISYDDIEQFYTDLSSPKYENQEFVPTHTSFASDLTFKNVPYVYKNGMWQPIEVRSFQRTAILVPLQGRDYNAKVFLLNLHAFFRRQLLTYKIFIIEQIYPQNKFNKGRLYNTAFNYIRNRSSLNITCYVLHDVDLIPDDDSNYYTCETKNPKHTTSRIRQLIKAQYVKYYEFLIGGVLILTYDHYKALNGFSNLYWGWGGEDDDLALRVVQQRMCIIRPPAESAIYSALPHQRGQRNSQRFDLLTWSTIRMHTDGLSNIENLTNIEEIKVLTTVTHLKVNVDVINDAGRSKRTSSAPLERTKTTTLETLFLLKKKDT
ncbi:unnamed protein product [Didymodactylos carnosus]|uniref:Beta-1,4-galactosyltransferase n=1 Tax=Didymodactylos carnosus TaxID=1234261 RepID=A0A8S2GXH4_9BILA|nr:unnamed protein product [Didymodactylos carnosus]CAF3573998.1 unnamed protein product [Didymodactylos carnosus]